MASFLEKNKTRIAAGAAFGAVVGAVISMRGSRAPPRRQKRPAEEVKGRVNQGSELYQWIVNSMPQRVLDKNECAKYKKELEGKLAAGKRLAADELTRLKEKAEDYDEQAEDELKAGDLNWAYESDATANLYKQAHELASAAK